MVVNMYGSIELNEDDSSWIRSITYLRGGVLVVTLRDKQYLYRDVAPDVARDFVKADSHGQYFLRNIKGQYDGVAL